MGNGKSHATSPLSITYDMEELKRSSAKSKSGSVKSETWSTHERKQASVDHALKMYERHEKVSEEGREQIRNALYDQTHHYKCPAVPDDMCAVCGDKSLPSAIYSKYKNLEIVVCLPCILRAGVIQRISPAKGRLVAYRKPISQIKEFLQKGKPRLVNMRGLLTKQCSNCNSKTDFFLKKTKSKTVRTTDRAEYDNEYRLCIPCEVHYWRKYGK